MCFGSLQELTAFLQQLVGAVRSTLCPFLLYVWVLVFLSLKTTQQTAPSKNSLTPLPSFSFLFHLFAYIHYLLYFACIYSLSVACVSFCLPSRTFIFIGQGLEPFLLWNPPGTKSNKNGIINLLFEIGMKGFSLPLPSSFLEGEEENKKRRLLLPPES